jgi:hypothetical protein
MDLKHECAAQHLLLTRKMGRWGIKSKLPKDKTAKATEYQNWLLNGAFAFRTLSLQTQGMLSWP